jgi:hypothetical protein
VPNNDQKSRKNLKYFMLQVLITNVAVVSSSEKTTLILALFWFDADTMDFINALRVASIRQAGCAFTGPPLRRHSSSAT